MAKPVPGLPAHHLDLYLTVRGDVFSLAGVFPLEQGLAAFDRWVRTLDGGVLTAEQVADLLVRAESLARRLETLDTDTP